VVAVILLRNTTSDIRKILENLVQGKIDVDEAIRLLRLFSIQSIETSVKFDEGRILRRDIPEIVIAEEKDPQTLVKLIEKLVPRIGKVIISRLSGEHMDAIKRFTQSRNIVLKLNEIGRIAVIKLRGTTEKHKLPCKVGLITAGTADLHVAEEARVVIEEMGCNVITIYDVGIAGLHRTLAAVRRLKEEDVDAVIVIAGMEGALPSIVASLLDIPVIGVPTSVGYGAGAKGWAALLSMLQACPLGLAVVNIDNGVNAAIIARLIARRIGVMREKLNKCSSNTVLSS